MLSNFEGAIGVKTGYTKEAGRCLVSAAKRGNMTLVSTVLNCQPMYERSSNLLEDAFSTYHYEPFVRKGDQFLIKHGKEDFFGVSRTEYSYPLSEGEESQTEIVVFPFFAKEDKEIIGQIQIYLSKRLLFSGNLYKL